MADQKVSDLPALNGADVDAADLLYIVDSSAGSAGSKKITVGQYQLAPVSGGTANGVVYLNGSKVVTTGSGLVFDGTNLGVGTSSPGAKLHVKVGTNQNLLTTSTSSKVTNLAVDDAGSGYVDWQQYANQFLWFTASTERMTLDTSGNLGIGISSPQAVLHVNKATTSTFRLSATNVGIDIQSLDGAGYGLVSTYTNHPLVFSTNANERARITSGGDLLVGTMTLAGAGGFSFQSQSGTGFAAINNNNAGATGYVFSSYRRSSVEIGSITQNGTTAVLFNTTSDRRLKDNIVPAPSASAVIDAIEIVSHDWKAAPDEHVTYGVIAQDLAVVAPQAVLQGDDGDEIEKAWGVDYSKLVPMLIKEIQSLRARVAALESA